jgi:hypothetical protein
MERLKKIVQLRNVKNKSKPLEVFEERMKDSMSLEGAILSNKLSEKIIDEAKNQMIIVMVSCYEAYLRDIFGFIIDEELVPLDKLFKIKQLKNLSFNMKELEFVRKENIKLSEIVCNYINFQNFDNMKQALSIINLDKKFRKKIENKSNIMPPPEMRIKKSSSKKEIEDTISEWANEFFKQFAKNKKTFNIEQLYSSLRFLLKVRHLIVHQNIKFKIDQDEILQFTSALYEFVMILDEIIQELLLEKEAK